MTRIQTLMARARKAREAARGAKSGPEKDRYVMRAERLEDEAWSLNEADKNSGPLYSGPWGKWGLAAG